MTPFDHSRYDWYPATLGGPGEVQGSNGSPRPPLATPLSVFGVHYGGAGSQWLDLGDTAAELRGIELNHARPSGKPNEYNSASDSASETWEYAGPFRAAHSSGNNDTVWGHLAVYGLEKLTDAQADALIKGIRRARAQCVTAGYLTPGHLVRPHSQLPGARTACPGPLWTNPVWWGRIIAPLRPADFDVVEPTIPPPPIQPSPQGVDLMLYIAKPSYAGVTATTPWLAVFESGQVRRAINADVKYAQANGVAIIDQDSAEQHAYLVAKFGI